MINFEGGRWIEPQSLVRLINSTDYGTVITRAKLSVHQDAAGYRIGDNKRIDIWAYTAWLFGEIAKLDATEEKEIERDDDLTAELNQDQEPEDAPPEPEPVIETEAQMIDYVFRWMLEGNSTNDILTSIIAKYPQGDAEQILKKTRERFADHSTPDGKELIGFIFEAQRKIYRDMLKIGDYGGALRALQAQHLLAERLGILKEKRNEGGFSIEGLLRDA